MRTAAWDSAADQDELVEMPQMARHHTSQDIPSF